MRIFSSPNLLPDLAESAGFVVGRFATLISTVQFKLRREFRNCRFRIYAKFALRMMAVEVIRIDRGSTLPSVIQLSRQPLQ